MSVNVRSVNVISSVSRWKHHNYCVTIGLVNIPNRITFNDKLRIDNLGAVKFVKMSDVVLGIKAKILFMLHKVRHFGFKLNTTRS